MRGKLLVCAAALLFVCAGAAPADVPVWLNHGKIEVNGAAIKVAYDSNPFVVDWNNDGAKDLLVGQFTQGNILLYLNVGTDLNPVFDVGEKVESGGSPITTTYG